MSGYPGNYPGNYQQQQRPPQQQYQPPAYAPPQHAPPPTTPYGGGYVPPATSPYAPLSAHSPYAPPSGPPPGSAYQQAPYGGYQSPYAPPSRPPPGQYTPPAGPPGQHSYAPPSGTPAAGGYAPPTGVPPTSTYTPPPGLASPAGQYNYQMPTAVPTWAPPPGMPVGPYGYGGSTCTGTKKALFVGINYFGTASELKGCINDVRNVKSFITRTYGFREDPNHMLTLTDDQQQWQFKPTRANIIAGINWLVQGVRPGDSLFFHFSGHGGQQKDTDGDEDDGYDETICPVDYKSAGQITDDELNQLLVRPLPAGVRLTAVIDSCHSGSMLDLPYMYLADGTVKETSMMKKAGSLALGVGMKLMKKDKIGAAMQLFQGVTQLANSGGGQNKQQQEANKGSPADVFMFSGCKDSQTSADTFKQGFGATGAMSHSLLKALSMSPHQSYAQLLTLVRQILQHEYHQIPQMSTAHLTDMNQPFNM